jgi:hypothetical protein
MILVNQVARCEDDELDLGVALPKALTEIGEHILDRASRKRRA